MFSSNRDVDPHEADFTFGSDDEPEWLMRSDTDESGDVEDSEIPVAPSRRSSRSGLATATGGEDGIDCQDPRPSRRRTAKGGEPVSGQKFEAAYQRRSNRGASRRMDGTQSDSDSSSMFSRPGGVITESQMSEEVGNVGAAVPMVNAFPFENERRQPHQPDPVVVPAVAVDDQHERIIHNRMEELERENQELRIRQRQKQTEKELEAAREREQPPETRYEDDSKVEEERKSKSKSHAKKEDQENSGDGVRNAICVGCIAVIIAFVGLFSIIFLVRSLGTDRKLYNNLHLKSPTLQAIKQRSNLICGVENLPHQAFINPKTKKREGFTADLCRAIAAAIFGMADDRIEFQEVYQQSHFKHLSDGHIDILITGRTCTMEREVYELSSGGEAFHFSTPYMYDGMMYGGIPEFLACAESISMNRANPILILPLDQALLQTEGRKNRLSCDGLIVCVPEDTTAEAAVRRLLLMNATIIPTADTLESYNEFISGRCNVISDESLFLPRSAIEQYGYSGPYEVGTIMFTKEPLGFTTRQDDPIWNDFVDSVMQSLLAAEAKNIGQANAAEMPLVPHHFGVDHATMWVDAIREVGNYGEIYERHYEGIVPRADINMINRGNTSLIYSFPFGDFSVVGDGPVEGGTLERVKKRGILHCGIVRRAIFADQFFPDGGGDEDWLGYDVDFCRVVSAAVFRGNTYSINYKVFSASEIFLALQSGEIDVISGSVPATIDVDIAEPTTGEGFSFTLPIFYDGMMVGGLPQFVQCADQVDYDSEECKDLKICVKEGTFHAQKLLEFFPSTSIAVVDPSNEISFDTDLCNAVAGGIAEVSLVNMRTRSNYMGYYIVGEKRFTVEPYALITRQDDPQWSMFCKWLVSALYFAGERGIKQQMVHNVDMAREILPPVALFGDDYEDMYHDAVWAVGSIKEIYDRHLKNELPREGTPNEENRIPYRPQHFSSIIHGVVDGFGE